MCKPWSLRVKIAIGGMVSGFVCYQIGSILDNGMIEKIVEAHQPLYMNTLPQQVMIYSVLAIAVSVLALLGMACDLKFPMVRLGIDRC
jgi:hypothetical protein